MADEKKQEPVSKQPPSGEVKPGDQESELNEKELDKASGELLTISARFSRADNDRSGWRLHRRQPFF
jgi:hypothetical protein